MRLNLVARRPFETAPTGRLLLLSPHLDDAALSCAALLARSEPVDIITVFAGQPDPPKRGDWDETTGFTSSAESMPVRHQEDAIAFAGSPHKVVTLSLIELQYVFGGRSPSEAKPIEAAVRDWLTHGPGCVALPVGAGYRPSRVHVRLRHPCRPADGAEWHPDHLFVRDTVLSAFGHRCDTTFVLYEELPYLWSGGAHGRARQKARQIGRRALPFRIPVDPSAKAERIRSYASQTPYMTIAGRRVDDPLYLAGAERYWLLPPRGEGGG